MSRSPRNSYDILHLLPSALTLPSPSSEPPQNPRGFTHLPSLHEDLFFLTPSERALVAHKERRRKMEKEREERVREVERLEREEEERVRREGGEDEEVRLASFPCPALVCAD